MFGSEVLVFLVLNSIQVQLTDLFDFQTRAFARNVIAAQIRIFYSSAN